ncbi:MAG: response regulator [Candidatus Omnitrophica bacterium]|nr:response regulator [Candidatus Omnitrophota bacterium]
MSEKQWRILLVDDEPSIIKMVGKRLELEGFEVFTATDGEQAIEFATTRHPDLIVLDLLLPKKDGFAVTETLKRNQNARDIPIIAVFSGKGVLEDEDRCRELGAAAYIEKGRGATPLVEAIRNLLSQTGDN